MKTKEFASVTVFAFAMTGLTLIGGCGTDVNDSTAEENKAATVSQDIDVKPALQPAVAKDVIDAVPNAPDNAVEEEMVIEEEDADKATESAKAEKSDAEKEAAKKTDEKNDDNAAADSPIDDALKSEIVETDGVMLNSIILARGVDKREPLEPGTRFTMGDGEKIYVILDVKNDTGEDATLTVSWKMPESDREVGKTELSVKSAKSWRTWSFTRWAKKIGKWEAVVRNASDEVIARAPFEVLE